jgi:hypothetical protein
MQTTNSSIQESRLQAGEISMKFNKWSQKRILEGKKTLTSRTKRHDNDDDVIHIFGPFPLWFICTYLYRDEGAESPTELKRVINQIFRQDVDLKREFYVHVLNVTKIKERLA